MPPGGAQVLFGNLLNRFNTVVYVLLIYMHVVGRGSDYEIHSLLKGAWCNESLKDTRSMTFVINV